MNSVYLKSFYGQVELVRGEIEMQVGGIDIQVFREPLGVKLVHQEHGQKGLFSGGRKFVIDF